MSKQVHAYHKNEAKDSFEAKYGAPTDPKAWSVAVGLMRAVYVTLPTDRQELSKPADLYPLDRHAADYYESDPPRFAANSIGAGIIHEMMAAGKDWQSIPGEHEANQILREAVFAQRLSFLELVSHYSKRLFEVHNQTQARRDIIAGSIMGKTGNRSYEDKVKTNLEAESIDPFADEILRIYRVKNQDQYRTPETDPPGDYEWHPVPEYRPRVSDLLREMRLSPNPSTVRKICNQYGLPLDPSPGQRSS